MDEPPHVNRRFSVTWEDTEGAIVEGKQVCVEEDVVTSGGQILSQPMISRSAGTKTDTVLCFVDRETGANEKLGSKGLELRVLLTRTELDNTIEA